MRTLLSAMALAIRAIIRNKMRALLTILGILIGVTSVVVVTALGQGATAMVGAQIAALGSNAIIVQPQSANVSGAKKQAGEGVRLTIEDGLTIMRESTSLKAFAPNLQAKAQVVANGTNASTSVIGTTSSFFEIRAWTIASGAIWEESDEKVSAKVCVIGESTKKALFPDGDPVGQVLRIGRYPFKIIGVLAPKGQGAFGDQDDVVIMPHGTFRTHVSFVPPGTAGTILFSATSEETTNRAVRQITSVLRQRHHIVADQPDDFRIRTQAEFQAMQQGIFGSLSLLLMSVAAVSLLVGGIGIMNIMLVSVAERTREIGIRMAIGARENDILSQFLIESLLLSLMGGVVGLMLSVALVYFLGKSFGWPLLLDMKSVVVAIGVSGAIGVTFGFFPARRAAKMDPIVALRRE
jgi:putative ABC transport system permease protein